MAEFTAQLGNAPGAPRPINTEKAPVDFIRPLTSLGTGIGKIFEDRQADRLAAEKAQKQLDKDNALNDLARVSFDIRTMPEGKNISRYASAERAGAMSSSAARTRMEVEVRKILNKYPDQAFEVYTNLDEMGIDTALFREFNNMQEQADAANQKVIDSRNAAKDAVIARGIDIETMSEEDVLAMGRGFLTQDAMFKQEVENFNYYTSQMSEQRAVRDQEIQEAGELRSIQSAERAERADRRASQAHGWKVADRNRETAARNAVSTLKLNYGNALPGALNSLINLSLNTATNDKESLAALDEAGAEVLRQIQTSRLSGIEQLSQMEGLDQKHIDNWNKYMDDYSSLVTEVMTGDLSQRQRSLNTLADFTTDAQLEFSEIAPAAAKVRAVVGPNGLTTLMLEAFQESDLPSVVGEGVGSWMESVATDAMTIPDTPGSVEAPVSSERAVFWKSMRNLISEGGADAYNTPEHYRAYASGVLKSAAAVRDAPLLDDAQGVTILSDLLSPNNVTYMQRMRQDNPEIAAKADSAMTEAVSRSMQAITTKMGASALDLEGKTEGAPSRLEAMSILGRGGLPPIGGMATESGVKWDPVNLRYVAFGGLPAEARKAAALNSGLTYMMEQYGGKGYTSQQVIDVFVFNDFSSFTEDQESETTDE